MAFDANYPYRTLILRGNGADGSTTITDDSQTPKSATISGTGVAITTAQSVFGGASIGFAGGGSILFSHADFTCENDVILECRMRHGIGTGGSYPVLVLGEFAGSDNSVMLMVDGYQLKAYFSNLGSTSAINSGVYPDAGTWTALELSRTGGVWRLFVDGTLRGSSSSSVTVGGAGKARVGGCEGFANFVGQLDDIRVSRGLAGHTASFAVATEEIGTEAPMVYVQMPLVAPKLTMAMAIGARADLTAPGRAASMIFGRHWQLQAPTRQLSMQLSSVVNRMALVAPGRSLALEFGARFALASPGRAVVISGQTMGRLSMTLAGPGQALEMAGTVSGAFSTSMTAPGRALAAQFGMRVVGAVAPRPQMVLGIRTGTLMVLALAAPRGRLHAEISAQGPGMVFDLVAPRARLLPALRMGLAAPRWTLAMEVAEVVEVAYDCFVLNLRSQDDGPAELTRYTNWPFDKVFRLGDDYFAVAADGIYRLGGETDHAVPEPIDIPWSWRTALTDFGVPAMKTVPTVYFSGRLGRSMDVTWQVGEKGDTVYRYRSRRDDTAQNYREKLGRGLKARYFAVGAEGEGEFELDTLDFEVHTLSRRI